MKIRYIAAIFVLPLLGVGHASADTRNSDHEQATREQKAAPSTPGKQEEEQTEAHSQPDAPASSGGAERGNNASGSASAGSSAAGGSSATGSSQGGGSAAPQFPNSGDYYQSNENKADPTSQPAAK
jgi:hypothetical protein